jgi:hypothetical protein
LRRFFLSSGRRVMRNYCIARRHCPSTSLNASRAFRNASIPDGMPQ